MVAAPGPHEVHTIGQLAERLRALQVWAGTSFRELHREVRRLRAARGETDQPSLNTIHRCMDPGRSRLDADLVVDIATVLLGDPARAAEWRQAHQVASGRAAEASVVTVLPDLPPDPASFTGRQAELAVADRAGRLLLIDGMAGVGKSTLAVHAAHRLVRSGRFADLRFTVHLRGHDPVRPAADPGAVLDALLRQLGCPPHQIHGLDLPLRTAKYRELLAGRRALILLDDAAGAEQVRPLLPDDASCLVIVTSRHRLAGLPAADQLSLDVFSADEALRLLGRTAGASRIEADPGTAARIADAVGQLPLALALAGRRIGATPGWTLTDHLERLVEHRQNFQLDDGVEAAIRLSYDGLPDPPRRLLRLLALQPGRVSDGYLAAALADVPLDQAGSDLAALHEASLVHQRAEGRYQLHDLVQIFAARRARDEEPARTRRAALGRLLDYYRYTAAVAVEAITPQQAPDGFTAAGTETPELTGYAAAAGWLEQESSNLVAAGVYAADHGWPDHAGDLSSILHAYLVHAARPRDALVLHQAAARAGSGAAKERALVNLAAVQMWFGRYPEAVAGFRRAAKFYRRRGDQALTTTALLKLSSVQWRMGDYAGCEATAREALELARETGNRHAEYTSRTALGEALWRFRRYGEAQREHQRCLQIAREIGDRDGEALALARAGRTFANQQEFDQSFGCLGQALAATRAIANRVSEGYVLLELGAVHTIVEAPASGLPLQQQAAAIGSGVGDPFLQATALNELVRSLLRAGRYHDALDHARDVLALADEIRALDLRAGAHDQLAQALVATGDPSAARTHWQRSLELYRQMGTPEVADIERQLRLVGRDPVPSRPVR